MLSDTSAKLCKKGKYYYIVGSKNLCEIIYVNPDNMQDEQSDQCNQMHSHF